MQKSYSVKKYLEAVKRLIQKEIPPIWVNGTLTQVSLRGSVCYLSLADIQDDATRPDAVLNLVMFSTEYARIQKILGESGASLREDLKVCFRVEADFYVPFGKFQAKVLDVDPAYTMGAMALARKKILDQLKAEGLFDRNRSLEFPELPLRIGLITAEGSAAHNDFMDVLKESGFSFQVFLAGARMQGKDTESSVCQGLKVLENKVDVICIVRGGGAKAELAWFDSEAICRAVALSPVPVISGIGHEIDTSLTDDIAWANKITPTATARFLVDRLLLVWNRLEEIQAGVAAGVQSRVLRERQTIQSFGKQITRGLPARVQREKQQLRVLSHGLEVGPKKILAIHAATYQRFQQVVTGKWSARLAAEKLRLSRVIPQLRSAASHQIESERQTLPLKERLIKNADPQKALKRGYGIIRKQRPDGVSTVVRNAELVEEGDLLELDLDKGSVQARVEKKITKFAPHESE